MAPNTRKQKSRISEDLSCYISELDLSKEDQVDVISLSLKKLGLMDKINFTRKPTKSGRKLTPLHFRKAAWDFWHAKSTASTLTSRPAILRTTDKPRIQAGLDFVSTVNIICQRNKSFYKNNWMIINESVKVLYLKFLQANPGVKISYGTFLSLKPFYVQSATSKDIEMCCCKKHLHARWATKALIENCSKQNIWLGEINDCYSFFNFLTKHCTKDTMTHLSWGYTPNKDEMCNEISHQWNELKSNILNDDKATTVNMQHFQTLEVVTKKGKLVTRLKAISTTANLEFITNFTEQSLSSIIHHVNQLKHYRSTLGVFKENFDTISLDVHFSENLSIQVKYEPQSLHWSHQKVTIHSGIRKIKGEKSYDPYVSNNLKHDQQFVQLAITEMLREVEIQGDEYIVIESDKCSSQYKSSAHFHGMQLLANNWNVNIIRVYGIAEHGNGKFDHVGGLSKTAVRRAVAEGDFLLIQLILWIF